MTSEEFSKAVRKVSGKRVAKVKDSYGVLEAYKYYNNHRGENSMSFTRAKYYSIIKAVNKRLEEILMSGRKISIIGGLGTIELKKFKSQPYFDKEHSLKVPMPIDWNATLQLWYEDPQAYANRQLLKMEAAERIVAWYCPGNAKNNTYFTFTLSRDNKKKAKQLFEDKELIVFYANGKNNKYS